MEAAFLDFGSLGPEQLDTRPLTDLLPDIRLYPATRPCDLPARIASAGILIVNKVVLDRAAFAMAPRLRLVCLAATGTDNVDLAAAAERGITVCNIRNYGTPSVVQHVFGLILALTLRLPALRSLLAEGAWSRSPHPTLLALPVRELAGRTLGIVGYGRLGQATAAVARAFGMEILAAARPGVDYPAAAVRRLALPALLSGADVVSLHCPLTPATRHLIDGASIGLMRPDALLINTARGGLVDDLALLAALRDGRLGGAGIDVLAEEPPPADAPLVSADLPNLILTPHVAWAALESRQRALVAVVENLRAWLAGTPVNRVA